MWQAVAREEGITYRFAKYDNVSEKLNAVKSGEADLAIGGISVTLEREVDVIFLKPPFGLVSTFWYGATKLPG